MENDCSSLITELMGDGSSKSDMSWIVKDIRSLMENLREYKLSKIHRSRNEVAHHLARRCHSSVTEGVTLGSVPPYAVSLIQNDCNAYSAVWLIYKYTFKKKRILKWKSFFVNSIYVIYSYKVSSNLREK
jgi:hypothetical protein